MYDPSYFVKLYVNLCKLRLKLMWRTEFADDRKQSAVRSHVSCPESVQRHQQQRRFRKPKEKDEMLFSNACHAMEKSSFLF